MDIKIIVSEDYLKFGKKLSDLMLKLSDKVKGVMILTGNGFVSCSPDNEKEAKVAIRLIKPFVKSNFI